MYIIHDPINRIYCINGWICHYHHPTHHHPYLFANPDAPPVPPAPPAPPTPPVRHK